MSLERDISIVKIHIQNEKKQLAKALEYENMLSARIEKLHDSNNSKDLEQALDLHDRVVQQVRKIKSKIEDLKEKEAVLLDDSREERYFEESIADFPIEEKKESLRPADEDQYLDGAILDYFSDIIDEDDEENLGEERNVEQTKVKSPRVIKKKITNQKKCSCKNKKALKVILISSALILLGIAFFKMKK